MRASQMRILSVMRLRNSLPGVGMLPTSAVPGGPQFLRTFTEVSSSMKILYVLEDYRTTAMPQQRRAGRRRFADRSIGRKISSHYRNADLRFEWLGESAFRFQHSAFSTVSYTVFIG